MRNEQKHLDLLVFLLDLLHFRLQQLHHGGALKLTLLQGEEQELDEGGVQNDGPSEGLFHASEPGAEGPMAPHGTSWS